MTALGPGTRVRCCVSPAGQWTHDGIGPECGSVWIVERVIHSHGETYLELHEWHLPDAFNAKSFRPLDGNAEFSRLRAILTDIRDPDAKELEPREVEA